MFHPKLSLITAVSGLLVLTGVLTTILVATQSTPATTPLEPLTAPPAMVTVGTAVTTEMRQTLTLIGSLVPRNEVQVGSDSDGYRLIDVAVDQGEEVKAGQVLAVLDTDRIDAQLAQNAATLAKDDALIAQARSMIEQMQSAATAAATDLARANGLSVGAVITQQLMDQRISAAKASDAQLASAQAGLAAAEAERALTQAQRNDLLLTREKTTIRSPCGGIVLSRAAEVGQVVSSSTGAMFRIARDGEFEVAVQVDEPSLMQVQPGQKVQVALAFDSHVPGTVRSISREVDKTTRLTEARIALDPSTPLSSGMFARAEIEIERHQAIAVPTSSIVFEGGASVVRVLASGSIQSRLISAGISEGGMTEVTQGINAGETIVLRAGAFVHDGEAVIAVADEGGSK